MTKQANSVRSDVRGDLKALGEYKASIVAKFLQRSSDTVEDKMDGLNFTNQLRIQQGQLDF